MQRKCDLPGSSPCSLFLPYAPSCRTWTHRCAHTCICKWIVVGCSVSHERKEEGRRRKRMGFREVPARAHEMHIPCGVFTATTEHSVELALAGLGFLCCWFGHVDMFNNNYWEIHSAACASTSTMARRCSHGEAAVLVAGTWVVARPLCCLRVYAV